MNEYLPLLTLWRLLGVLALTMSPHLLRLPVWVSLLITALLSWRALSAYHQWPMPRMPLKVVLTLLAGGGIVAQYGSVSGQQAGTALLCLMAALKLLELKARRDVMVMVFLMYFLLLTHFLVSQEIWTVAFLLICAVAITAILIECQHRGALSPRLTLRKSGIMVAQALPLMIVMFVLFPRIPGPLWGLPADAGAARSGLSDTMSPGDISSLIESDEIAFRVRFDTAPPANSAMYWRGPVLDHFDGRTWENAFPITAAGYEPEIERLGQRVVYEITLEPHRMRWLFGLDLPRRDHLPGDAIMSREAQLMATKSVIERRRYSLVSDTDYRLQPTATERMVRRNLALPAKFNPQTLELGRRWRQSLGNDARIVDAALRMFREQPFVYTLRPPPLGRNSADEFLFTTRRGFCEHYASAFTLLMRAADVPARVVTGYQGGQLNEIGGYYVVRQSDAHAWSEVWLSGRGWVRVDPTAAVAPERIERGIEGSISAGEGLPGYLSNRTRLRFYFEARWDWINARWNAMVLAYGPELQQQFLSRFGLDDLRSMILALTVIVTLAMAAVGLVLLRQSLPAPIRDPALREWRRFTRKLGKLGLVQRTDEGPRDFINRVNELHPDLSERANRILMLYLNNRYLDNRDATVADLRQAVSALRL
ncbi:DUF3488 domain-containing protein [Sinimarinibacterium sp. CAU 1509]|uniref:transglutaminase TgpA family protein n=1 Tax=Sinimarinibacterium sp. CAU 1509 TaxID=2562283 RepID=UPI0010AB50B9|nr:DUF3488 and transglutaminase-like domain-containing protein [Sinimarinibacterium sp. CAU 1509]TJY61119.1 DUF3488 domain-containing protein [Sinimarinibacterium sp. CAU 1509]